MQSRHLLVPLCIVLLLAGCSSATSASKANFAKAISVALTKRCITVDPGGLLVLGSGYPIDTGMPDSGLDALVKAGLLTHKHAGFGHVYSLTATGKKALEPSSLHGTAFCAGHYKLAEVVDWTAPGHLMGETISEVTYTYSPVDIAPWARTAAVRTTFPKRFAAQQKAQAQLVLKNDGWSVYSLGLYP